MLFDKYGQEFDIKKSVEFIGKTVLDPIGYEVTFSDGTSDYTT